MLIHREKNLFDSRLHEDVGHGLDDCIPPSGLPGKLEIAHEQGGQDEKYRKNNQCNF